MTKKPIHITVNRFHTWVPKVNACDISTPGLMKYTFEFVNFEIQVSMLI